LADCIIASSVGAADIRVDPGVPERERAKQFPLTDFSHLEISGEIVEGDADKLGKALAQLSVNYIPNANPIVFLNSPGGNVNVALEMGRILRVSLAHTVVDKGATCGSSCIFVFAGGVIRNTVRGGRLALHRPRFAYESFGNLSADQARTAYTAAVSRCADFMKEMSISEQVLSVMLRVPSQEVRFIDTKGAEKYGPDGRDPAWEEWSRALDVKRFGEAYVKARDRLLECLNGAGAGVFDSQAEAEANMQESKRKCFERFHSELQQIEKRDRR
jgi:hypothetical protein